MKTLTVEELHLKLNTAKENAAKIQSTLERHEARRNKKLKALTDKGWSTTDKYALKGTPDYNEHYWAVCAYEDILESITNTKIKLDKANESIDKWLIECQTAAQKMFKINELPQIFKNLIIDYTMEWDKWDYAKNDEKKYPEPRKAIHKRNLLAAQFMVLDLYNRVIEITGNVVGIVHTEVVHGALNAIITGKDGKAKVVTILAGGWNIQRLHCRTLVHKLS